MTKIILQMETFGVIIDIKLQTLAGCLSDMNIYKFNFSFVYDLHNCSGHLKSLLLIIALFQSDL